MNDIIYNGQSLRDLGYAVKTFPVHTVAERDMEFSSVISRSGDIIIDNKRYKNVDIPPYEINMIDFDRLQNTDANERRLIDWLMAGDAEYNILEDSTVPGYFCNYWLACFIFYLIKSNRTVFAVGYNVYNTPAYYKIECEVISLPWSCNRLAIALKIFSGC